MLGVQFLSKNSMTLVPHSPFSPDLALSNHFLFPQMKKFLKGKHGADMKEVKKNLNGIKIDKL